MEEAVGAFIFKKVVVRKRRRESSSSESDDDEILFRMANKIEHSTHGKVENFVQIVKKYSLSDFQSHFRISKTKFEELLSVIEPAMQRNMRRPSYPVKDSLLLTIWGLATQESFREIGSRFNVSEGHAFRVFIKTCCTISNFQEKYIVWPIGQDADNQVQKFNSLRGERSFPNVFGCLDGTHIPILGPKDDNSYYNRKGFHSIQLQAICNSQLQFMNVYCGWPGSVHDARIWRASNVCRKLEEDPLSLLPANTYLLGDSAYALKKYLITPFKDNGNLTRQQRRFNARLSSTRVVIEQAFGRLKGMFRRLKFLNIMKLSNAKYIIIAACVLHNISIDELVAEDIGEVPEDAQDPDYEEVDVPPREAVELRNSIMVSLV